MWSFEGDIVVAFLQSEQGMMILVIGLAVGLAAVLFVVIMQSRTARRDREQAAQDMHRLAELSEGLARHQGDLAERMAAAQAELSGRMQQSQSGVSERLDQLSKRVGDGLHQQTEKTGENLKQLAERLAVIDRAQQTITDLSQQMVGLQDILSTKQSRGAFGLRFPGDAIQRQTRGLSSATAQSAGIDCHRFEISAGEFSKPAQCR